MFPIQTTILFHKSFSSDNGNKGEYKSKKNEENKSSPSVGECQVRIENGRIHVELYSRSCGVCQHHVILPGSGDYVADLVFVSYLGGTV